MPVPTAALRRFYAPTTVTLLLLAPFAIYFLLYVPSQERYFADRDLRILASIASHIQQKVVNSQTVLQNASKKGAGAEEFIRRFVPDLKPAVANAAPGVTVLTGAGNARLHFAYMAAGAAVHAEVPVESVVAPLIPAQVFDDVLVAQQDGRVIYQYAENGLRLLALEGFEDAQGKKLGFAALAQSSATRDVQYAGTRYKLFAQPLRLAQGAGADIEWVLCGLVRSERFFSESLAISYTIIIGFTFLLLLAILSWPFFKLCYLGPRERLRLTDGLLLILSTLLSTALVTLLALDSYFYLLVHRRTDEQLERFASAIDSHVRGEIERIAGQLDALSRKPEFAADVAKLAAGGANASRENLLEWCGRDCRAYPWLDSAFWIDPDGTQRLKWSVRREATAFINIAERPYYGGGKAQHLWSMDRPGGSLLFRLEPTYTITTGEHLATFYTPLAAGRGGGVLTTAFAVTPLLSLISPVVPPGFGYRIIDAGGKVLFHSPEMQNTDEDFFAECDQNGRLRAAVFGRGRESMTINYMGRGHRAFVTPFTSVPDLPWSIVAFRDMIVPRTMNLEVLTIALALFLGYSLAVFLPLVISYLVRPGFAAHWIWPNQDRSEEYRYIIGAYTILVALFIAWIATARGAELLYGAALLTVVAVVIGYMKVRYAESLAGWSRPAVWASVAGLAALGALPRTLLFHNSWVHTSVTAVALAAVAASVFSRRITAAVRHMARPSCRAGYMTAAFLALLLAGALPCIAFFKLAYDYEAELLVKYGQRELAGALAGRADRVAQRYRSIHGAGPELLAERTSVDGEALDTYFRAFFDTEVRPLDRRSAPPAGGEGLSRFLRFLALSYNEVAISVRGLVQRASADGAWIWQPDYSAKPPRLNLYARAGSLQVRTVLPSLSAPQDAYAWAGIILLPLAGFFWLRLAARKLFLFDLEEPPELDRTALCRPYTSNLLVLAEPQSGKTACLNGRTDTFTVDLRALVGAERWADTFDYNGLPPDKVVVVDHFEHRIDDAQANRDRLHFIEQLVYARHRRVVILSTVDPLYYFSCSTGPGGEPQDRQLVDAWAAALSSFDRAIFEPHEEIPAAKLADEYAAALKGPNALRAASLLAEECRHSARLRRIGSEIVASIGSRPVPEAGRLVSLVLDRANVYYRALWAGCSPEEKLVLVQLAQGGLVNPKSQPEIQQLLRKRLIVRDPVFRMMNASFRRFVLADGRPEELIGWEKQEARSGGWGKVKGALLTLLILLAAFLFVTQRDVFQSSMAFLAALPAGIAALMNLLGVIAGRQK